MCCWSRLIDRFLAYGKPENSSDWREKENYDEPYRFWYSANAPILGENHIDESKDRKRDLDNEKNYPHPGHGSIV
jgi:hypothetical protein